MKMKNLTSVSLTSALFIIASTFTPGHAAEPKPAPTGADCQKKGSEAAEKVRKNGGTDKEQQAAYERAKENCRGKM